MKMRTGVLETNATYVRVECRGTGLADRSRAVKRCAKMTQETTGAATESNHKGVAADSATVAVTDATGTRSR